MNPSQVSHEDFKKKFDEMLLVYHNREKAFEAAFDALEIPVSERPRYRGKMAEDGTQASLARIHHSIHAKHEKRHPLTGRDRAVPNGDRDNAD